MTAIETKRGVMHCSIVGANGLRIEVNAPCRNSGEIRRWTFTASEARQLADALHDCADELEMDAFSDLTHSMMRDPRVALAYAYRTKFEED